MHFARGMGGKSPIVQRKFCKKNIFDKTVWDFLKVGSLNFLRYCCFIWGKPSHVFRICPLNPPHLQGHQKREEENGDGKLMGRRCSSIKNPMYSEQNKKKQKKSLLLHKKQVCFPQHLIGEALFHTYKTLWISKTRPY